jgi:hypothetical protein
LSAPLSREEAIRELARTLHSKMEHLDPSDGPEWEALTERQREFYTLCVKAVLFEGELVRVALR